MNGRSRESRKPGSAPVRTVGGAARWWALASILLLAVTVLVTFRSLQASGEPQAGSVRPSETTSLLSGSGVPATSPGAPPALGNVEPGAPSSVGTPATAFGAPAAGAPTALRIPALDMDESLITLGLNPDGTVEVPTDFSRAGWYEFGPAPGEPGSAVILGHVDSFAGPAVFHRLRELETDDMVDVGLADGGIAHFTVTAVETYPKNEFPAERVYGSNGGTTLQLVTCGGDFDSDARSYVSNVVAFTSLVGITPPGSQR